MKCSEINSKMIAYLENDLPKAEMSAFQDHLSECTHCMKIYTGFKKTWQVIDEEKNIQADDFYFTRLEQAIKNRNPLPDSPVNYSLWAFTRKAAAVLLILISAGAGIMIGAGYTGTVEAAAYQDEYEYFSEVMYLDSSEKEPIENYLLNEEDE